MEYGQAVVFNDGEDKLLALVRNFDEQGADLVVFTKDGASFENNVPRRSPKDYGPEGGGRTFHLRAEA